MGKGSLIAAINEQILILLGFVGLRSKRPREVILRYKDRNCTYDIR